MKIISQSNNLVGLDKLNISANHFRDFISATKKILLRAFLRAESHKQAWTSGDKSYVITKRCLKTIGMTEKIKWSQADLNR